MSIRKNNPIFRGCIHIHWLRSLSYNRSIASSKAISTRNAIRCFLFLFTVSLPFLKVTRKMLTSSPLSSRHFYPPSIFLSITCFRRQFLCKMWPTQLAFLFYFCRIFFSSPYTNGKTQTDQYVFAQTTQVTVLAVLTSAKRKAVSPVNLSPNPRSVLISISVTLCSKIVFLWISKFNFAL